MKGDNRRAAVLCQCGHPRDQHLDVGCVGAHVRTVAMLCECSAFESGGRS